MDEYIKYFQKYKWYVLIVQFLLGVCLTAYLYLTKEPGSNGLEQPSLQGKNGVVEGVSAQQCSVFVDISGAVNKPNVYCLNEGELLIDAIKKAGGYKDNLVAKEFVNANVNLARPLVNNEKIYIPSKREVSCKRLSYELVDQSVSEKNDQGSSKKCVSLNSASVSELDSLNGIGESLANKIIEGRPYKSIEDLNEVSGIGDELFNNLKGLVCI